MNWKEHDAVQNNFKETNSEKQKESMAGLCIVARVVACHMTRSSRLKETSRLDKHSYFQYPIVAL